MKGLLMKDLVLLKNQKQFFAVILIIGLGFLFTSDNPSGGITYVMALSSMCMVSTISYDEFENGFGYLFTLPITRKKYVIEKYVFGLFSLLATTIAISLFAIGIMRLKEIEYSMKEYGIIVIIGFLLTIILIAIQVPVRLRFRAEKSTIAMMAILALLVGFGAALYELLQFFGVDVTKFQRQIENVAFGNMVLIGILITLTLLSISYIISVRIMNRKEF